MFRVVRSLGTLPKRIDTSLMGACGWRCRHKNNVENLTPAVIGVVQRCSYHASQSSGEKLDEFFPEVVDFPGRHIGPRKHESRAMLKDLGYNVSITYPIMTIE